ncbi:hypothetical protein HDV62DRAFT_3902 [Trichoderma sp. SZMC 28011]
MPLVGASCVLLLVTWFIMYLLVNSPLAKRDTWHHRVFASIFSWMLAIYLSPTCSLTHAPAFAFSKRSYN